MSAVTSIPGPNPIDYNVWGRRAARAIRPAILDWIEESDCRWCLTLNPNRTHTLGTELNIIRQAFADADRDFLGARFNKVDGRKRALAFIMPEHVTSNLHFHLAVRPGMAVDEAEQQSRVAALASRWQARVPSGTFMVEPMINVAGWGRYITKELGRGEADFMTSSMWWPERQRRHVLERSWRDPMTPRRGV